MAHEENQHTPTPWRIGKSGYRYIDGVGVAAPIYAPDGSGILAFVFKKEGVECNARRICAAVNACAGITTEALEFAAAENIRLDFAGRSARITELETSIPAIRLLEALKWTVENLQEASALTDNEGSDYTEVYRPVINAARAAIAAAEGNEPVAMILPGWENMRLKTSARRPYDDEALKQYEPDGP